MRAVVASSRSARNIGGCADARRHKRLNRSGIPGPNQTLKRNPHDENTMVSQPASGDRVDMIQFRRVSSSVQTLMKTATSFGKGVSLRRNVRNASPCRAGADVSNCPNGLRANCDSSGYCSFDDNSGRGTGRPRSHGRSKGLSLYRSGSREA